MTTSTEERSAAPPRLRDSADSSTKGGLKTPSENKCNDSLSLATQREDCCGLKTKIFFETLVEAESAAAAELCSLTHSLFFSPTLENLYF